MAPRTPESLSEFVKRLTKALDDGDEVVPFGQHHFSHAVCAEEGRFRVRRLECTPEEADAYLKEHGMFMPEHQEAISKPRTLVYDAESLVALQAWLTRRWPL